MSLKCTFWHILFCLFIYRSSLSMIWESVILPLNQIYITTKYFFFPFAWEGIYHIYFFVLCRLDCILVFSSVINHLWNCLHVLYYTILNDVHVKPYSSWENNGQILVIFHIIVRCICWPSILNTNSNVVFHIVNKCLIGIIQIANMC